MNKTEREKLRQRITDPNMLAGTNFMTVIALLDHIDALETANHELELKVELVMVDGKNYCAGDVRQMLSRIDALEGQIEAAFREGYSAGYSAGSAGVSNMKADSEDCWNLSQSRAAIASASEVQNASHD
jgi:hypothetical protein